MTLESDLKKNALASMVNEAQMLQDHFKFSIDDAKLSQVYNYRILITSVLAHV